TGVLRVSPTRAKAIREVAAHYEALFGTAPSLAKLREQYAMTEGALPDTEHRQALTAFFFWAAWSTATDRPGETGLSYTSNWPHEPLVANTPTPGTGIWLIASIILLIGGIAGMVWFYSAQKEEADPAAPKGDPLLDLTPTPS